MIPIARPLLGEEERQAVLSVLASGKLAQGPVVRDFETAFAEYCGARCAVATSSGTTALHLALLAHGIGPGDEVITSPFTFVATANAVVYTGARPVFADIEPDSLNLDPAQVEQRLTSRTRAIIPVHLFGHPVDVDRFQEIARAREIALIQDACQAHGASYRGQRIGSSGTACFSFYATKNMTSAEGGMVTTDDKALAERLRMLRNHGMNRRYYHETLGYNFRTTDLQAAIGLAQLRKLDSFNDARIANAGYLTRHLQDVVECPAVRPEVRHVFHQFTVRVPLDRDGLQSGLRALGVETGIYYPVPLHLQEGLGKFRCVSGSFPVAENACREVLSLPVHPGLSQMDLETIVEGVRQVMGRLQL